MTRRREPSMPARSLQERFRRGVLRALAHTTLLAMWGATLGAVVLWPRWTQWQGAQSSLRIQTAAGADLSDRLQFLQTTQRAYEEWSARRRRALLPAEVPGFCAALTALLRGTGAQVVSLQRDPGVPVPVAAELPAPEPGAPRAFTGTVRVVPVTLALQGDFPAVYRSVARLEGQRFLAIVRGADLARIAPVASAGPGPQPAAARSPIRAAIRFHLFVLQSDATDHLTASAPADPRLPGIVGGAS
jgi:hypothetical protein